MFEVRVLGDIAVTQDGEDVDIGGLQPKTLLARLVASAGSVVAEDSLVVAIWGDDPPATARNSLQSKVSRLRRALGASTVEASGSGYRLATDAVDIDADRFERLIAEARATSEHVRRFDLLSEALELWRGTAFGGVEAEAVRAAGVRLDELRLTAAEERFDAAIASGRSAELVDEIRQLGAEHPGRERLCRQLMLCLHRAGRSAEALDVGRRFRARLAEETGLDPSSAFAELESSIASNDPRLDAEPSAPRPAARVPALPTSIVGREQDTADVTALLERERIVTLRGVGGVGKTRLALEVARQHGGDVWVVELAALSDPSAVSSAVARTLKIRDRGGSIREALVDRIGLAPALLVLDNCEHVLDAVAELVSFLVRELPNLTVLATSREVLNVAGEHVWHVNPLEVASDDSVSVELFCQRAQAVRPDLVVDEDCRREAAEIVRRLDGLPLAIELAAARADRLTLREIAERLSEPLRFLVGGRRDADDRHRGLHDVVDWSYRMLEDDVRAVFDRMAVFAGGCSLEAIAAVAAGPGVDTWDIERAVDRLVDTSLVGARATPVGTRYSMLDTVAAFAHERLLERGELETTVKRHARWTVGFVHRVNEGVYGADDVAWQLRLEQETANVLAAGRRLLDAGDSESIIEFWAALGAFSADTFGALLEEPLARRAEPVICASRHPLRGDALSALCFAFWGAGDLEAARRFGRMGAEAGSAFATYGEGAMALFQGDLAASEELLLRAADLQEVEILAADHALVATLAIAYSGRVTEALELLEEHRAVIDASGCGQLQAWMHYYRGEILLVADELDPPAADAELSEAVRLAREMHRPFIEAMALVSLASLVARTGEVQRAVTLFRETIEALRPIQPTQFWTAMRNLSELLLRLDEVEVAAYIRTAAMSAAGASALYGAEAERDTLVSGLLEQRLGTTRYREICDQARGAPRAEVTDRALRILERIVRERWGEGGFRTVVFTDVVDSTQLTSEHGNTASRELLAECEGLTRALLAEHNGEGVKWQGDGVLATFAQPSAALAFALELQDSVRATSSIKIKIGIHAGEVVEEDGDIHGLAVNVASRVTDCASAGQTLLTDTVRQLVAGTVFVCTEIGSRELKGVPEPVRLYALRT